MVSLLPASSAARKNGYDSLVDTAARCPLAKTGPSQASLFSKLFFSYANPMMAEGNRRQLDNYDLWELEGENKTVDAYARYRHQYERCGQSVIRAMFYTYGRSFVMCGIAMVFSMACSVFAPAVLHHVIDAFAAPEIDGMDLAMWLSAFFVSKIVDALVTAQMRFRIEILALRLIVSMKSLLFEKATRRKIQSKSDSDDAADLANLMSSDVDNVLWAAFDANSVWVLPIQIVAVVIMLYYVLDLAAFAGLAVICLSMLASFLVAKRESEAFEDVMEREDALMRTIKEVFGAIQIVKLNAWEARFGAKIRNVRAWELRATTRFMYIGAFNVFLLWVAPVFVSMTSFAVYSIGMKQQLTAAKVFTAMALFNALREPLQQLPDVVSRFIQAKVSLDRMQEFLSVDEYDSTNIIRDGSTYPKDVAIEIKDGSFGWSKDTALLKNVNMTVKQGDFVIVHGAVGAGKSSLCSALLGEMDKLSGSVFVRGRVAYYSQQTWIQNMTIRENILFGKAYDEKLYQRVLDSCGLLPDLDGFPAGDTTEIGQKGVNLSGGQKARLCLARACYADADVLILDSPLAAVDAVVQSEIFSKCLCTLLESKTVVLVTHAPDIIASEAANFKLEVVDGVVSGERRDPVKRRAAYVTRLSPRRAKEVTDQADKVVDDDGGHLVDDEEREAGRVSKDVFLKYFDALGGTGVCVFIFATQILWQAFQIGSDFWLSHWTGQNLGKGDEAKTEYNMKIYMVLGLGSACLVLVREITVAFTGIKAAKHLFNLMTRSLLHAPMRFFDANPIGRIINRYGDDMSAVDFRLPFSLGAFLATLFSTGCQLAAAVYTVNALGILVVPLLYVYVKIANFYLAPSREIARLTKIAESPVLSHVTACEEGVALLRAFGPNYIHRSILANCQLNDVHNKVWFANAVVDHWFQLRMQLIGCGLVIIIVSTLVSLHSVLSPGIVGLAFTYALSVDAGLSEVIYSWSWVEICMVSPERILEYASIPSEGDSQLLQIQPAPQWPQRGTIDFENVVFSYKEGASPVLKGLSFSIKNNEKIGIVGRTGAGKSSLTMALFRINELVGGRVSIDGVDISTMPLQSLRSHLSIIPQSPVLFKGTLRAYMDPFDEYTDEEIWTAFEKVEMKEQISALEGQLAYELSENGENFSVGERQMLCMARAMLTKSRIVVMDEATASIDHATEKKLQHMINRDFQEATVLTIAHRLATVLDSDRIMVLSDGRVVEFDTPANLVKNKDGMFYELAQEGGYLEQLNGTPSD